MLCGAQEAVRLLLEIVDADPRVRGQDPSGQRPHVGVVPRVVLGHERTQPAVVALVGRFPRLPITQLRLRLRHRHESAKDEVKLDRHRLLAPQGAVVVEHRDPLLDRHSGRSVLAGYTVNERNDRLFGRPSRRSTTIQRARGHPSGGRHWRPTAIRGEHGDGLAFQVEVGLAGHVDG
jgi:hypothetical protein